MSNTITYRALIVPTSSFDTAEFFYVLEALGFDFSGRNETLYSIEPIRNFLQSKPSFFEEAKNSYEYIVLFQGGGNDRTMSLNFDNYPVFRMESFATRYSYPNFSDTKEIDFSDITRNHILWLQEKEIPTKPITTRSWKLVKWLRKLINNKIF